MRIATLFAGLLLGAAALVVGGMSTRTRIDGHYITPLIGAVLVFSGMIAFGLGMVLLLRNPLAAPADERFMRRVWMGPIGKLIFEISVDAATSTPVRTKSAATAAMAPRILPANVDARLASLEARVRQLEQR